MRSSLSFFGLCHHDRCGLTKKRILNEPVEEDVNATQEDGERTGNKQDDDRQISSVGRAGPRHLLQLADDVQRPRWPERGHAPAR